MILRATSFATRKDLAAFAHAICQGHSVRAALRVGDNGVGAWDDETWRPDGDLICALAPGLAKHNDRVRVKLSVGNKKPFVCFVRDVAPPGVIDLNPAALVAAGLSPDYELSDNAASWEPCVAS